MRASTIAKLVAVAALPLVLGLSSSTPSPPAFHFTRQSSPQVQTVVGWMMINVVAKGVEAAGGATATREDVFDYFALAGRVSRIEQVAWEPSAVGPREIAAPSAGLSALRSELDILKANVEALIQQQVAAALLDAGLGHQIAGRNVLFPPPVFRFESLPKLLVVSPRTKIERAGTVLLNSRLTLKDAESLEDSISALGYSALVTRIGGLGVYPSMVPESSDIQFAVDTVAHEWTHQYLALRPLGWKYAFGAEKDPRMVTINETVAEIVGREIGSRVYREHYRGRSLEQPQSARGDGSFRRILRDVRLAVDGLLAKGKVDEAEALMDEAREELSRRGYSIRKLNQAYFAFHGSYADEPSLAGGEGENVAGRIHALRSDSGSLGHFLSRISGIGSYEEFLRATQLP